MRDARLISASDPGQPPGMPQWNQPSGPPPPWTPNGPAGPQRLWREPTEGPPGIFAAPNIGEDVAALGQIVRSGFVLIPLFLLLIGLVIFMALPAMSPGLAGRAGYYIQFFFAPPALIPFLAAGLLAPRAGYLVGFIYGVIAAGIWSIAILAVGRSAVVDPAAPQAAAPLDVPMVVLNMLVIGILYGTGFAALGRLVRRVFARLLWQPS